MIAARKDVAVVFKMFSVLESAWNELQQENNQAMGLVVAGGASGQTIGGDNQPPPSSSSPAASEPSSSSSSSPSSPSGSSSSHIKKMLQSLHVICECLRTIVSKRANGVTHETLHSRIQLLLRIVSVVSRQYYSQQASVRTSEGATITITRQGEPAEPATSVHGSSGGEMDTGSSSSSSGTPADQGSTVAGVWTCAQMLDVLVLAYELVFLWSERLPTMYLRHTADNPSLARFTGPLFEVAADLSFNLLTTAPSPVQAQLVPAALATLVSSLAFLQASDPTYRAYQTGQQQAIHTEEKRKEWWQAVQGLVGDALQMREQVVYTRYFPAFVFAYVSVLASREGERTGLAQRAIDLLEIWSPSSSSSTAPSTPPSLSHHLAFLRAFTVITEAILGNSPPSPSDASGNTDATNIPPATTASPPAADRANESKVAIEKMAGECRRLHAKFHCSPAAHHLSALPVYCLSGILQAVDPNGALSKTNSTATSDPSTAAAGGGESSGDSSSTSSGTGMPPATVASSADAGARANVAHGCIDHLRQMVLQSVDDASRADQPCNPPRHPLSACLRLSAQTTTTPLCPSPTPSRTVPHLCVLLSVAVSNSAWLFQGFERVCALVIDHMIDTVDDTWMLVGLDIATSSASSSTVLQQQTTASTAAHKAAGTWAGIWFPDPLPPLLSSPPESSSPTPSLSTQKNEALGEWISSEPFRLLPYTARSASSLFASLTPASQLCLLDCLRARLRMIHFGWRWYNLYASKALKAAKTDRVRLQRRAVGIIHNAIFLTTTMFLTATLNSPQSSNPSPPSIQTTAASSASAASQATTSGSGGSAGGGDEGNSTHNTSVGDGTPHSNSRPDRSKLELFPAVADIYASLEFCRYISEFDMQ